ncbi:hypothetical protein [Kordiimonas aestuarii]|uniref:hypothetical protein n=1 Tax=Kordiimonas aestuarii TaxID=1005925 RepID=UPI0021D06C04|nr:hypothetical protein [Kordiimonas aestuarii]
MLGVEGLSLDAGLEAVGKTYASSYIADDGQLQAPARITMDAGLRYAVPVRETKVTTAF